MIYGFSDRLKELRKQKGISQQQLANHLGVSKTAVANYEVDKTFPVFEIFYEICSYLEVSADYMLGLDRKKRILVDGITDSQNLILKSLIKEITSQED